MPAGTYKAPKLQPATMHSLDQGHFDFLVPYRTPLLRPDQVAASLERSRRFVYRLYQEGTLEGHGVPGRDVERLRITKRSTLIYLAESANYKPGDMVDRMAEVAASLTAAQWAEFIQKANHRRSKV